MEQIRKSGATDKPQRGQTRKMFITAMLGASLALVGASQAMAHPGGPPQGQFNKPGPPPQGAYQKPSPPARPDYRPAPPPPRHDYRPAPPPRRHNPPPRPPEHRRHWYSFPWW
ncbi:MAG: hypothetical protein LBU39_02795 [Desulfobulbaceae bacterium]|nr:hypothetical protein [Desulfobulbaceae bacterium]